MGSHASNQRRLDGGTPYLYTWIIGDTSGVPTPAPTAPLVKAAAAASNGPPLHPASALTVLTVAVLMATSQLHHAPSTTQGAPPSFRPSSPATSAAAPPYWALLASPDDPAFSQDKCFPRQHSVLPHLGPASTAYQRALTPRCTAAALADDQACLPLPTLAEQHILQDSDLYIPQQPAGVTTNTGNDDVENPENQGVIVPRPDGPAVLPQAPVERV